MEIAVALITLLIVIVVGVNSKQIDLLINLKNQQEMNNTELVQALQEVGAKLNKAAGEIVSKITALELALNNQVHGISKEAELELNALKLAAQRLDDVVPDVTVEPVAEEETPSEETPYSVMITVRRNSNYSGRN